MLQENIHALIRCRNLGELIQAAKKMLSNPLILANLSLHVLSVTQDFEIQDPRWIEINEKMILPLNIVNISLYQSALHSAAPVVTKDSTGLTIVRCAIAQDGKMIGYLLSPCYYGEPPQEELDILAILADLCGLRMQKDLHYAEYPKDMLEFFISDLLNGTITDEQTILDRCRYFHWNLKMPYRVVTIRPESTGETDSGADYLFLEGKRQALQRVFPDSTTFLYGNQIKMIIYVIDQTTRDTLVLQQLTEVLKQEALVGGISQIAHRFRNLSLRHEQAVKALQMGLLFSGEGPLFRYDTHSVYHCLELCSNQVNLLQLCHAAVLVLEAYDRANDTELLGTLHAYLICNRNVSEAANSLYIHRNTLSKRLDKINDLIHVDFSDAETFFHLLFSYRILEYYGATMMRNSYESWMEKSPGLRHR